ncbi:CHAT domain-containing protein [Minwuia thermotolerans]|nr:CHAT domain-containing protein [Minwuia thermotolerans]
MHEVHATCQALLQVRVFAGFHDCMDELEQRVAANGGHYWRYSIMSMGDEMDFLNRPWSQAKLGMMRAFAWYYQGELEKAHTEAATVLTLADENKFLTVWQQDRQESSGFTKFMLEIPEDNKGRRNLYQARTLGMLGSIEIEWGDERAARERIARLEAMDASDYEGIHEMRGNFSALHETKSMWLARLYLALDEHENAYAAMTRERDRSLNEAFFLAVQTINYINPLFQAMTLDIAGSLDIEDVRFAQRFEPRFMLHRAELETGRLAEAKAGYDDILAEPRVKGFGSVYWQALHGRGRIALAEGDQAAAIGYFERAVRVIESQRRSIETEAGRMSFVGDKQAVYRDLIGALIREGRVSEAFAYAERGKARALVDILASKESFGDAAVRPREAALLERYQAQETRLKQQAREEGFDIATRSADARAELIAAAPELASLVTVPAFSAAELQALIPAGEALVEYYRQGDSLFAFVADRNRVQAFELSTDGLDEAIGRFRRALSRPGGDAWRAPGEVLHARLVRPLTTAVGGRQVTIVPHGALHYLPFAAIPTTDGGFLMDEWEIAVLPSASVLKFIGRNRAGERLLALGNPDLGDPELDLPGAEAEAVAIARATPQAETLLRGNATETALRRRASAHDVLHLASHGVFDPTNPLSSALLLTADGEHDGRLTASEIYELRLDASLVTLSACQTGLGRVRSGDDVVGLTRGFLFSGADAIVASLWLVDDAATSELMQAFYRARPEVGARAALRQAQQELRESGKTHPYYWAAFQLTGAESRGGAGA